MQDETRAARALFRLRGLVENSVGMPTDALLERLAACAREATDAVSAVLVRTEDPAPAEDGLLCVPVNGASGGRAGYLRLELHPQRPRLSHLALEVVNVCAAQASAALVEEAQRESRQRAEDRRTAVLSVVRASRQHLDLENLLRDAVEALRRGVRCQGVWIRAFDSPHPASLRRYAASYPKWADALATDELLDISGRAARLCWERGMVSSLHLEQLDVEPVTSPDERDFMFAFMRSIEASGLLMAPMGGAGECQGFISLTRTTVHEPFDSEDEATVMTIGREVGAAVVQARLFDRQRVLVQELQELDAYKNRFIATVAHQIKSPLTSIVGHTEVLSDAAEGPGIDPEQGRRSLDTMRRGADRIRETVDALLTLGKVQDADRAFVPGEVLLGRLVAECVDLVSVSAAERRITVDTSAVDPDVRAWGVREELEKVVDNLVGNAVKYSPDGSEVVLALGREEDQLVFECRDHGFGIQGEDLERLFDPFYRSVDPRMLEIPGTGMGMTIFKAVVDRHGGSIEVESAPNVGSVFKVVLPRAPDIE